MRTKTIVGIVVAIIAVIAPLIFLIGGGIGAKERLIKDVSYIGFKAGEWLAEEFTTKPEEKGWYLAYELKANNETARFTAYLLKCSARTFFDTLANKPPTEWDPGIIAWKGSGGSKMTGEIADLEGSVVYTFVFMCQIGSLGANKLTLVRP